MMKKILFSVLTFLTSITMTYTPTHAATISSADIGTYVATTTEALREGYEGTVIARMMGRSGAKAPYGAKGISFEVLYSDKLNLENIGKNCITKLSDSSIDQLADLITICDDEIVEVIQCKNVISEAGVDNVVGQLIGNRYPGASIVTTSESAAMITSRLNELGLEATVIDSGIDHAVTVRIADKCRGVITPKFIEDLCKHSTSIAAGFASVAALYDSIQNGDDIGETVANVSTNAGKAATSMAIATTAGEVAGATVATIGAGSAAQIAIPMVIVLVAGVGADKGLDILFEATGLEGKIAGATNSVCEIMKEKTAEFTDKVCDVNVKSKLADAKEVVGNKIESAKVSLSAKTERVYCSNK